jgi:hypothetical protein
MAKKTAPKLKTLRHKLDAAYSKMKQERAKNREEEAAEEAGGECNCGKGNCKACAGYK